MPSLIRVVRSTVAVPPAVRFTASSSTCCADRERKRTAATVSDPLATSPWSPDRSEQTISSTNSGGSSCGSGSSGGMIPAKQSASTSTSSVLSVSQFPTKDRDRDVEAPAKEAHASAAAASALSLLAQAATVVNYTPASDTDTAAAARYQRASSSSSASPRSRQFRPLGPNDVLLGGPADAPTSRRAALKNIGNVRYRLTVEWNLPKYIAAGKADDQAGERMRLGRHRQIGRQRQIIDNVIGCITSSECGEPRGKFYIWDEEREQYIVLYSGRRGRGQAGRDTSRDESSREELVRCITRTFEAAGRYYAAVRSRNVSGSSSSRIRQRLQDRKRSTDRTDTLTAAASTDDRRSASSSSSSSSCCQGSRATTATSVSTAAANGSSTASHPNTSTTHGLIAIDGITKNDVLLCPSPSSTSEQQRQQHQQGQQDIPDLLWTTNVGNRRLWVMIQLHLTKYRHAINSTHPNADNSRKEVIQSVLEGLSNCCQPARFLRMNKKEEDPTTTTFTALSEAEVLDQVNKWFRSAIKYFDAQPKQKLLLLQQQQQKDKVASSKDIAQCKSAAAIRRLSFKVLKERSKSPSKAVETSSARQGQLKRQEGGGRRPLRRWAERERECLQKLNGLMDVGSDSSSSDSMEHSANGGNFTASASKRISKVNTSDYARSFAKALAEAKLKARVVQQATAAVTAAEGGAKIKDVVAAAVSANPSIHSSVVIALAQGKEQLQPQLSLATAATIHRSGSNPSPAGANESSAELPTCSKPIASTDQKQRAGSPLPREKRACAPDKLATARRVSFMAPRSGQTLSALAAPDICDNDTGNPPSKIRRVSILRPSKHCASGPHQADQDSVSTQDQTNTDVVSEPAAKIPRRVSRCGQPLGTMAIVNKTVSDGRASSTFVLGSRRVSDHCSSILQAAISAAAELEDENDSKATSEAEFSGSKDQQGALNGIYDTPTELSDVIGGMMMMARQASHA